MNEEPEQYVKAFAIERPDGSIFMNLFLYKEMAYRFIEEKYGKDWSTVQRKHKFRIIKVEIVKRKWR